MTESVAKRAEGAPAPNFADLVEDALLQLKTLVQVELSLARRELASEAQTALGSAITLLVGAMFLQAALVTLGVLLVLALGVSVAASAVVVALAAIGGACVWAGARALGKRKLPRTSARLALDAKQVLETVK